MHYAVCIHHGYLGLMSCSLAMSWQYTPWVSLRPLAKRPCFFVHPSSLHKPYSLCRTQRTGLLWPSTRIQAKSQAKERRTGFERKGGVEEKVKKVMGLHFLTKFTEYLLITQSTSHFRLKKCLSKGKRCQILSGVILKLWYLTSCGMIKKTTKKTPKQK